MALDRSGSMNFQISGRNPRELCVPTDPYKPTDIIPPRTIPPRPPHPHRTDPDSEEEILDEGHLTGDMAEVSARYLYDIHPGESRFNYPITDGYLPENHARRDPVYYSECPARYLLSEKQLP